MKSLPPLITLGLCASALAQPAPDAAVPIGSVFPPGLEWNSITTSGESVETRFGTLALEQGRRCSAEPIFGVELTLAGNSIASLGCTPDGDYYIVRFKDRFQHGDTDLVLLGADAGGSGSPPQRLHLIVLAPGTEPKILMDPDFRSSDDTQMIASDGRELWLDLGFRAGSVKRAHFDGSTFTIDYVPVLPMPVPLARCEHVYATLGDCQQRRRNRDYSGLTLSELLAVPGSVSNASRGNLQRLMQFPGFDGDAYMQFCARLVAPGEMPEFNEFQAAVCSGENATP